MRSFPYADFNAVFGLGSRFPFRNETEYGAPQAGCHSPLHFLQLAPVFELPLRSASVQIQRASGLIDGSGRPRSLLFFSALYAHERRPSKQTHPENFIWQTNPPSRRVALHWPKNCCVCVCVCIGLFVYLRERKREPLEPEQMVFRRKQISLPSCFLYASKMRGH